MFELRSEAIALFFDVDGAMEFEILENSVFLIKSVPDLILDVTDLKRLYLLELVDGFDGDDVLDTVITLKFYNKTKLAQTNTFNSNNFVQILDIDPETRKNLLKKSQ